MRVLLLTAVLCAAVAAPAAGAPGLLRVVQDDVTLLGPGRERALDEMRAAGVDVVRVNLIWRRLEGRGASVHWAAVDDLVEAARARGLRVLLTPTTPAPDRASRRRAGVRPGTWRPDPQAFAAFVGVAARRYSGRVDLWSLVNEPNNGSWLTPQQRRGRRLSPAIYRALVRAATPELLAAGHPPPLLGEQLGVGRRGGDELASVRPRAFLRDLLCLDARDRPTARPPGCRGAFAALDAGGWAVHPYSSPRGSRVPPVHPDTLTPATLGRLLPTLDAGRRHGRLARRVDLWSTEGGVQTNPPDRVFGAPPARQATILNETEAMLWRAPRVRAWGQYLWVDEPAVASFQSGLRYRDGKAKPALAAFRLPIDARRVSARRVRVWLRLPPGATVARLSTGAVLRGEGVVTATVHSRARRISARAGRFSSRAARVRSG
jgi:hypothetical protein